MTLRLIHGGGAARPVERRRAGNSPRPVPMLGEPSDDPIARRRELLVVLELCAARERGARELARPRVPNGDQSAATVPKS
jgi:hypothetical protein